MEKDCEIYCKKRSIRKQRENIFTKQSRERLRNSCMRTVKRRRDGDRKTKKKLCREEEGKRERKTTERVRRIKRPNERGNNDY